MADQIPHSRLYIHNKCGEVTEIGGGDFKNVASPVPGMVTTMCSACGKMFPISQFKWADSDEKIVAYYARHRARVPSPTKRLCSRPIRIAIMMTGFLAGIGFGFWVRNMFVAAGDFLPIVVSSVIGAIGSLTIWEGITNRVLSRSLGVPDIRCLR